MLLTMLFGLIMPAALLPGPALSSGADTLHISGVCWDVNTGIDLNARITTTIDGKQLQIGQSDATGVFTVGLPDQAKVMSIEVDGYPTTVLPVNVIGEINARNQFRISVPVIRKDSQHIISPYQNRSVATVAGQDSLAKRYFSVSDARTFRRIPAKVCFTTSDADQRKCIVADSAVRATSALFKPGERVNFQVLSDEFQPYEGTFTARAAGAAAELHHIRLLRTRDLLAISYDMPPGEQFGYKIYSDDGLTSSMFSFQMGFFEWGLYTPGKSYELVALSDREEIVERQAFRVQPGLNLMQFRVDPLRQASAAGRGTKPGLYFDSAVLYFDQSGYTLRAEVRKKLDSVSWQMVDRPGLTALLTGHTDNVGRRNLNMTLSEYRTRVVAQYLLQKGVRSAQLSSIWKGPDAPAASNDTEENRAKNRRVVLRYLAE